MSAASSIPAGYLTRPVPHRDHLEGPIEAPVSLLEFGDYECPYCGLAYPVVKAVQRKLGDRLCFAFRNFPLANMHPHAAHAAAAAEAAAAQGAFWPMHDWLFTHQHALGDEDLGQYATKLGLDADRLLREVLDGTHETRIKEDFHSGVRGGVNGTPSFFINGVRFDGPATVEGLLEALSV